MVIESAGTVEPILDSYGGYCCDTMSLLYTPFLIALLMVFRDETAIPSKYGIKEQDMEYYLIFALMIIPFQIAADIFIHGSLELFYGWRIHDYLVYSRYRFMQRETRWKGLEDSLDECIDASMRTLDHMCFSSQFYTMLTIHVNGIVYFVLGAEMMIRAEYNMFGDPTMPILISFIYLCVMSVKRLLMWLGSMLHIWRIRHENTAWHAAIQEEDDFDLPDSSNIHGASRDAFLMDEKITSETFRYKFINYNRSWIIDQLPSVLTPRTLRRGRPNILNQFNRVLNTLNKDISSDSDRDDSVKFDMPQLNASSRKLLRWWLNEAQRRLKLKEAILPLIQQGMNSHCEKCLSRKKLKVDSVVSFEEMDKKFTFQYPSENFNLVLWKSYWKTHQAYETKCLLCISQEKDMARSNTTQVSKIIQEHQGDNNWGPVFLQESSRAILMQWYKEAHENIFEGGEGRTRNSVDISDDEGGDVSFEWAQGKFVSDEATKGIALKWLLNSRVILQRRQK